MSSGLTKTTVYLPAAEYARLQALARGQKRSAAYLVREAVVQYVLRNGKPSRPRSLGVGRSGRSDLSEKAEQLLAGLGRRR